jgi:hypothetical protein
MQPTNMQKIERQNRRQPKNEHRQKSARATACDTLELLELLIFPIVFIGFLKVKAVGKVLSTLPTVSERS